MLLTRTQVRPTLNHRPTHHLSGLATAAEETNLSGGPEKHESGEELYLISMDHSESLPDAGSSSLHEVRALDAGALCWSCDPKQFQFQTTEQVEDLDEILGQPRALDAVQFGIGIRREGYNLYVLGPAGMGKRTVVRQFLEQRSAGEPTPSDWCYVHNFGDSHKPQALQLPSGQGQKLRADMERLVDDLRTAIPAALELEEHRTRLQEVEQESKERHDQAFRELAAQAEGQGIRLVRTPAGFALAPLKDGDVLGPDDFEKLTREEQKRIEDAVASLQEKLREIIEQVPQWRKDARDKIRELNREAARFAIAHLIAKIKKEYPDLPELLDYFDAVERDAVDHADEFRPQEEESVTLFGLPTRERGAFQRYKVNLLVDHGGTQGAPVVYEDHPTFQNLLGRAEHESRMGALITDFTLIKPGALHRANGGYLVVEVLRLLQQPFAWEGLKRALHSRRLKIESLGEALSLVSTVSLEPQPIPLDVKVVLLGDRLLYYLLYQYDPDFAELFKVAADFHEQMDRSPENCQLYARFVATLARREKHLRLDPAAVARVIEHSARAAGDSEKLSTHMGTVADLLREADHWARQGNGDTITADHIQKALDKQIYRVDRVRERLQEQIRRGTILIDTEGARSGQVNGLSVLDLGNFAFGQPSRITATARLGKGEVVDIEREVKLSGAIHSKGVLILSAFLAARYAKDRPLSLSASLVFEQSYGKVEGDSASVAELCALLSALAEAPIKQSLAVTGSVNQHGQVQAIGGVNQKIEGFFDICRIRGLTGDQGVLIPASNMQHLMLRREVVDAAAAGQFHVYPVETVDQAISLLTGVPAGVRDAHGNYPPNTINHRVEARLLELLELRLKYVREQASDKAHE